VFHLEDILAQYPRFNVVLGMFDYRRGAERLRMLSSSQVEHVEHFVLNPLYLDEIDHAFLDRHSADIEAMFSRLNDELSRRTLIGYISAVVTGDDTYLRDTYQPSQYFQDFAPVGKDDVVVDAGAYTGDTLEELVREGSGFAKYYAFEPDEPNLLRLSAMVEERRYSSVECIKAGLWRETTTLRFAGSVDGATNSNINDSGDVEILVDTIDRRCADATFIKMDIEGAELDALHGAKSTIERNKPTLAICAYHAPEHLWTLANYARSLVPEYKFFYRQHQTICTELVLYATV
jgi:FkbM family methyltransferase